MKIYSFIIFLLFTYSPVVAQIKTPALSPSALVKQTVGLTEITLSYSRPSKRGRAIFGENGILPYGQIWRIGANAATKLSFSADVEIMDNPIKKGDYSLLAKPQRDSWTLLGYAYESSNWNSYVEKTPLFEIQVPVEEASGSVETMEFRITDITFEKANLTFEWENVKWNIPIRLNTKEITLKSIARTMTGPSRGDYFQAAVYLHESGEDLETALTYIQKVTESGNARFFEVTREATILRDLGQDAAAVEVAKRGLELSKAAKNNDFVLLNERIIGIRP